MLGLYPFHGRLDSYVLVDAFDWKHRWSSRWPYRDYKVLMPADALDVLRELAQEDTELLDNVHAEFAPYGTCTQLAPDSKLDELSVALGAPPFYSHPSLPVGARFLVARKPLPRELPREHPSVRAPFEHTCRKAVRAPRDFVVIEVVDTRQRPVQGLRLELLLLGGELVTRSTDARGVLHLDNIPRGNVHMAVRDLDGGAWRSLEGAASTLVDQGRKRWHVVQRGENLSRIAGQYGIRSWKKLWDHPDNEKLRAKRKSPHVLYPGDQLAVPGIEVRGITRPTGQTHRIEVSEEVVELRVTLQDHNQLPYKDEPYELRITNRPDEVPRTGTTDGEGNVVEVVSPHVHILRLRLPEPGLSWTFALDELLPVPRRAELDDPADPATSEQAVRALQMRLNALGFPCGPVDGRYGARTDAALAMLRAQDLDMTATEPEALEDSLPASVHELEGGMLAQVDDMFEKAV